MSTLTPTDRTQIRRIPKRGSYERDVMNAILDEALVCHVGFVHRDGPFVIPTTFARIGERIFVHGAAASRMLGAISDHPLCVTVTLVDGLVLARSAFHHSMNYRSVVLLGRGRDVTLREEKLVALAAFIEKISVNRSAEVRAPSDKELAATRVITLDLTEASAKIRTGGPVDDAEDRERACWAGHIPLKLTRQEPVRDGVGEALAPELAAHFR
jgi:hypothetical protein